MADRWTAEQVLALAPDPASAAAGRRLASPASWVTAGASAEPAAVWGECTGSGAAVYRTMIDRSVTDRTGPAYSCSCPSRKFPCKHALGLLLRWSAGEVPAGAAPGPVAAWLAQRAARSAASSGKAGSGTAGSGTAGSGTAGSGPSAEAGAAARARAEQRQQRMLDGLGELDRWLCDQVRTGLAGTDRAGYAPFDAVAARLVDAQVPGVAAAVRQFAGIAVSGEGWPSRLLEEYALLHLLATAAPAVLTGPAGDGAPLAASLQAHLGVAVPKAEVLATPGLRDRWAVLALRDEADDRLTVRRVWLHGESSGRLGLVMTFAPPGQPLDVTLVPGTVLDAALHFYAAAVPLRALVGERYGVTPAGAVPAGGVGLTAGLEQWADALAADPWLRSWPVLLAGVVPVAGADGTWWLCDADGALPLTGPPDWLLLAVSGGHPVTLLAEIVPDGVRPVQVLGTVSGPAAVAS